MPCDNKPLVKPRGRGKAKKYIKPCPDNFRRTKDGAKLVQQEMKRLLEEQAKMYPHKAMLSPDQSHVRFTHSGTNKQIPLDELMEKAPGFFSVYYTTIRKKADFGQKVYDWFQAVTGLLCWLGSVLARQPDDEGSSSGSELVTEDDSEEDFSAKAAESEASDASLAQRLEHSIPRSTSRRKARPGYVELAVTASHVFCSGSYKKPKDRGPWRLVVLPRSLRTASGSTSWIGGGLEDDMSGGLSSSVAAAASAEEDAGVHFNQLQEAVVAFRNRESWRSLLTQHLDVSKISGVLLLNQSPVRVITNLLIFENRTKAAALCALNDWNPKQLPLLTLFLGLRFRELDEIRQSLGLLRPDQEPRREMQGCQMVMDFIHAGYSCSSMVPAFHPSPKTRDVDETARLAEPMERPADVPCCWRSQVYKID
eukprot:s3656_g5.t1